MINQHRDNQNNGTIEKLRMAGDNAINNSGSAPTDNYYSKSGARKETKYGQTK